MNAGKHRFAARSSMDISAANAEDVKFDAAGRQAAA